MPFANLYRYLFISLLVFLILGQLQRLQLTPTVAVYVHEILMLGTSGIALSKIVSKRKTFSHKFRKIFTRYKTFFFPVVYILAQTVLYAVFDFQPVPLLYLFRWGLYLTFFFSVFWAAQQKIFSATELRKAILFIGGGIATLGIAQYLIWPDLRWLYIYGWDDHYFRLVSTLLDPGFTVIVLITVGIFYLAEPLRKFSLPDRFVAIPYILLTILLTYSRAGYLAFGAALTTLTIFTKKIQFFIVLLLFLLTIPFLPRPGGEGVKLTRTASIEQRIDFNQQYLQRLTPMTWAVGEGMYRNISPGTKSIPEVHAKAPDNSLVFLLTSFGIFGTATLVPVLIATAKKAVKIPWLLAILVSWGVHSLFNLSLVYPWVVVLIAFLWIYSEFPKQKNL